MHNIKVILEYEGTNYSGFQKQGKKNPSPLPTIQEVIEASLYKLTGENIKIISASRTDAGVHALHQVINFKTKSPIPPERFSYALNSTLPRDIVAISSCKVSYDFHARYSAKSKVYKYFVLNSKYPSSLLRNFTCYVWEKLNLSAMKEGAKYLVGKHDFIAFRNTGTQTKTTICNLKQLDISKKDTLIIFTLEADRFLRGMIRCIVGTLLEVGLGKRNKDDIKEILKSKDRRKAGHTASPQGLFLVEVKY